MPTSDAFDLFVHGLAGLRGHPAGPAAALPARTRRPAGPAARTGGAGETKQPARHHAAETTGHY